MEVDINREEAIDPRAVMYADELIALGVPIKAINYIAENYQISPSVIKQNPRLFFIKNEVSKYFKLYYDEKENIYEMNIQAKEATIAIARQFTMFFCLRFTEATLETIGVIAGGKDHSTVIHSKKVVLNYVETSKKHKKIINDLDEIIANGIGRIKYPRV